MGKAGKVLATTVALLFAVPAAAQAKDAYTFGIVPQVPVAKLAKLWIPFMDAVSAESGVKVTFVTGQSMDDFHRGVLGGEYDFGLVNPISYARADKTYAPFARQAKVRLVGVFIVAKASPAKGLCDLKGKRIAVPSRGSFVASVVPMMMLQQECKLDLRKDVDVVIAGTHDNTYNLLLEGKADALGMNTRLHDMQADDVKAKVRVLARTKDFSNLPFIARKDVPAEVVARVQAAMLKIGKDPAHAPLLQAIGMPTGFETVAPADWDDVRGLLAELSHAAEAVASRPELK